MSSNDREQRNGAGSIIRENFDLVIAGGRIIDPAGEYNGVGDIGIRDGRIAAVASKIEAAGAKKRLDAADCIVTPGLIDMHTHVFTGASVLSIDADDYIAKTGTTTWLDAGTAGAANFPAFRRFVVDASNARIVPFLNVSAPGLPMGTRAHFSVADLDADLAAAVIDSHRDVIKGVKVLCSGPQAGPSGLIPLRVARELADTVGLPVMCHIGSPPPGLLAVLPLLRAGDIVTHAFKGKVGCLATMKREADGRFGAERIIRPEAWEAKERGVLFDIAHGCASFSWRVAEIALAEGFFPDFISTDLHARSVDGPAYGMPSVMSKFLHLGMAIEEVVRLSTNRPAETLGLSDEIGTLRPGKCADIAVLKITDGEFHMADCEDAEEIVHRKIEATHTIRAGIALESV